MAEFLAQYSIRRWMEMCPQGYLEDTVYGHEPDERKLTSCWRTTTSVRPQSGAR